MKYFKTVTVAALVLIVLILAFLGYNLVKQRNDISEHVSARINETVSELNSYIEGLNNGFVNQSMVDRGNVYVEIAVNQLDSDIEILKLFYPEIELNLEEIISGYVHLLEKKFYGINSHQATELMDELNFYIKMYEEAGIFSYDSSYETLIQKDEFVKDKIYETGGSRYRELLLEIAALK